jgi:hypothetical protein
MITLLTGRQQGILGASSEAEDATRVPESQAKIGYGIPFV